MANDRAGYSAEQKQEALAVLGQQQGNLSAASRLTSVPRRTLGYWATKAGIRGAQPDGTVLTGTTVEQEAVKSGWQRVVDLHLSELQKPEKAAKASAKDNVIVAGTAQDKVWVLSGRPTSHSASVVQIQFVGGARSLRELGEQAIRGELPEPAIARALPAGDPDAAA